MKVLYFPDTDTAYIELTNKEIVETRDFNENMILELDADGNLVAITIEHVRERARM